MRGEVGDVAADIGVETLLGFGMEARLDVLQRRDRFGDKIAFCDERRIELAIVLVQPVAADHRDIAACNIARTDFEDDRRALLDPTPALGLRLVRTRIEMDAQRLAKCVECLQFDFDATAIIENRLILLIVTQHRHDDNLVRCDARRTAQAIVVAMRHDDTADHAGRHAPARRVAQAVAAVLVLIADARRLGEAGSQIMRGPGLQRLAVLHHCLDRISRDRARKTLVLGLFARDDWHRENIFGKGTVHFERA